LEALNFIGARVTVKVIAQQKLEKKFCNSRFPKWGTMCLLKYLDLRVLDAAFIHPPASPTDVNKILESFIKLWNLEKILVRTDGGVETGNYMRGGNSIEISRAFELIRQILEHSRAVILTTPTNRFTNRLVVNLYLDANGTFRVELLGPGFDVADLNRGLIVPEISIEISNLNWNSYERPHPLFIKQTFSSQSLNEMRKIRLGRIGRELLPAIGITCQEPAEDFAEQWLRKKGYLQLFEKERPKIRFRRLNNWYDIAFIIGIAYRRAIVWQHLVISASDLNDGKGLVFWDIINPRKKFLIPV
jgi:hypothetical protein